MPSYSVRSSRGVAMFSGTLCISLLVALQLLMVTAADHCPLYQRAGQIALIQTCTKSQNQINKEQYKRPRYCT